MLGNQGTWTLIQMLSNQFNKILVKCSGPFKDRDGFQTLLKHVLLAFLQKEILIVKKQKGSG